MKTVGFFLISFGVTFLILFAVKQSPWQSLQIPLPSFAKATPTPTQTPTPQPPTPTPTPVLARKDIKIKILNGSGIAGKASVVKDFLKTKGYENILTGNADAFDYKTTVIQTKAKSPEIKSAVSADVSSQVAKPTFEDLADKEASDVILIIGTDFK